MSKNCLSYHDDARNWEGLKPVFDEVVRLVGEGRASVVAILDTM